MIVEMSDIFGIDDRWIVEWDGGCVTHPSREEADSHWESLVGSGRMGVHMYAAAGLTRRERIGALLEADRDQEE